MIQVGNSKALLEEFLTFLRSSFSITDDGPVKWFLGIDHDKSTGNIHASQTAYLERGLEKPEFGMEHTTPKKTPMEQGFKVTEADLNSHPDPEDVTLYRSMIGTLMYLSVWTRPDNSYAVNHMSKVSPKLIKAAKHIFRD
jgi:hypothetical protein